MKEVKLFTDVSVDPKSKIGFGAYLVVFQPQSPLEELKDQVNLRQFTSTSSTRLELQTLLWALDKLHLTTTNIHVYTDCQNILSLIDRRERLERQSYLGKGQQVLDNAELYRRFFEYIDQITCTFIKIDGHKTSEQKDINDRLFTLVDKASRRALREQIRSN